MHFRSSTWKVITVQLSFLADAQDTALQHFRFCETTQYLRNSIASLSRRYLNQHRWSPNTKLLTRIFRTTPIYVNTLTHTQAYQKARCKWVQVGARVGASGCKWVQVGASGCKWRVLLPAKSRSRRPLHRPDVFERVWRRASAESKPSREIAHQDATTIAFALCWGSTSDSRLPANQKRARDQLGPIWPTLASALAGFTSANRHTGTAVRSPILCCPLCLHILW